MFIWIFRYQRGLLNMFFTLFSIILELIIEKTLFLMELLAEFQWIVYIQFGHFLLKLLKVRYFHVLYHLCQFIWQFEDFALLWRLLWLLLFSWNVFLRFFLLFLEPCKCYLSDFLQGLNEKLYGHLLVKKWIFLENLHQLVSDGSFRCFVFTILG